MAFDFAPWRQSPRVVYWEDKLVHWVGVEPAEAERRVTVLLGFCASREASPDALFERAAVGDAECAEVVAETLAAGVGLVAQSFLIHNGVSPYGRLVCMPHTPDQLAQQGARFTPGARGPK